MSYRITKRAATKRRTGPQGGRDPGAPLRLDPWTPPELRRVIEVTDYDSGQPVTYRMELRRSRRIDCYDVYIAGQVWRRRCGWSRVLESMRKALPRMSSPLRAS